MSDTQKFIPYGRQSIDESDIERVVACLRGDWLTGGPLVSEFENKLAELVRAPHAVAVANGTAALHLCALAFGFGPDDEVVVPANTFIATANCVRYVGARVVFADVDPSTGLMCLESLQKVLSTRTRGVIPVHFAGAAMNMGAVRDVVGKDVFIIEDAAHAIGASFAAVPVGACTHSDATIFSFHPVKAATTGEGGAITTRSAELSRRFELLRNHGIERDDASLMMPSPGRWYYEMQALGFNYRLTDFQCALGLGQLEKLPNFIERRKAIAKLYDDLLADDDLLAGVPHVKPLERLPIPSESAWHLYVVRVDFAQVGRSRKEVMDALWARGIGTQVHYIPIPMQPYYQTLGHNMDRFPGCSEYYARSLSLPMFPALGDGDVRRVVHELRDLCRRTGSG